MRASYSQVGIRRRALKALVLAGMAAVGFSGAQAMADTRTFSFPVPKAPEDKPLSPAGLAGWGRLVMSFDKVITGGTFIFNPECPAGGPQPAGTVSANGKSILLGPGSYGLGQTGTPDTNVDPVQNFGTMDVVITYGGPPPPNIVYEASAGTTGGSFWEYKAAKLDDTSNYYVMGNFRDIGLIPEPGTMLLGASGMMILSSLGRRGSRHRPIGH